MNFSKNLAITFLCGLALHAVSQQAPTLLERRKVSILTQRNDNTRSGGNFSEKFLNRQNVDFKSQTFGKLFSVAVDGNIFAQPLIVADLQLKNGAIRDVLYVATEKNNVYAIDANNGEQIWSTNLGPPVPALDITIYGRGPLQMGNSWDYKDLYPNIGITSTPVIDIQNNTIFVVAKTKEGMDTNPEYHYRLHALDIKTGSTSQPSVEITGAVPGTAVDAHGRVTFNPFLQLNRPGLLLLNGKLYIAFGSHGDAGPFHGWIFRYDATAIDKAPLVFCSTPDRDGGQTLGTEARETYEWNRGGIWQSGLGLAADASGDIYFATGDGAWDGKRNFADSFLKLNSNLEILDWFTPWNHKELDSQDLDVGSTGAVLLPRNMLIGGSKEGKLYVLHTDSLGHISPTSQSEEGQIVQEIQVAALPQNPTPACSNCYHHLHGAPVFWPAQDGLHVYIWPEMESLKAYKLVNGRFVTDGQSRISAPLPMDAMQTSMPGGILALSSDNSTADTAVIWASMPIKENANRQNVSGILRAFDATDVRNELWNSQMNSADRLGYFAKYCPPTIANGKVYMATFAPETGYPAAVQTGPAHIVVYGLFGKSGRKPARELQTSVQLRNRATDQAHASR